MVTRTRLGGGVKSSSGFAQIMQPAAIERLASYIYIDKALVLKLAEIGMDVGRVDELRAILLLNQTPGFDISSPLDNYDDVVMALAAFIVEDNLDLIQDELRKVQAETLGLEIPEELPTEVEPEIPLTKEEAVVKEAGVEPKEVFIPERRRVVSKRTGAVTYRAKSVPYRKRSMPGLSSQEQFLYSRVEQPIEQTQHEYIAHFKIYRSKPALVTKQRRLTRRVTLIEEERKREETAKGMTPR